LLVVFGDKLISWVLRAESNSNVTSATVLC
jgi:hypothetical protein